MEGTNKARTLVENNYAAIRSAAMSTINYCISHFDLDWFDEVRINDILSDVFYKILVKGDTFDPSKANLKTWVRRITFNTVVSYLRGMNKWEQLYYEDEEGDLVDIPELGHREDPFAVVTAWETRDRVDAVLSRRSELSRTVMALSEQGYEPAEIAQQLGTTSNAVSLQLHKARRAVEAAIAA